MHIKYMKTLKNILLWIWQFPQHIVGLLILLFIKGESKHRFDGITYYYYDPFPGGISLGNYMILGDKWSQSIKHEYGHTLQSRILGPLYLPTVGLCSITWAGLYGSVIKETHNGYYKFWTEKWADKLGKVIRK